MKEFVGKERGMFFRLKNYLMFEKNELGRIGRLIVIELEEEHKNN